MPVQLTRRTKAEQLARDLLFLIDPNPYRSGLIETHKRWAKALDEWFVNVSDEDALKMLTSFEDGAPESADEIIMVSHIPLWSFCEHHIAPIFGMAYIGYLPDKRILGLSKFKRLVDVYAKRLQVQERLTAQIADTLCAGINPRGLGVVLHCRHSCMESRGVNMYGSITTTSALRGAFKEPALRAEFMALLPRPGDIRI